jgi:pimeloyl-ACP methyl ester carboxylesterase
LVDSVAADAGHVVVILDCCHSGSGTRGEVETVRRAPVDHRPRPLDSFLPGVLTVAEAMTPRGMKAGAGWYAGTRGRHVLLAACRDDQTAKEYTGDGQRRGAFSYFLVDTLKTFGGDLTYRDLFARTDSLVRSHIDAQTPQLEVVQAEDLAAKFLDGAVQTSSRYFIVDHTPGLATLRAGAIHGIARATADGTTVLALFPLSASDRDLDNLDHAVGQAKVIGVQAATCSLQISGLADPNTPATFKGIIVGLPTSRLVVRLEGKKEGVEAARTALKSAGQGGCPSIYVREVAELAETATLRLVAQRGQYLIKRIDSHRPLAEAIRDYSAASAELAIRPLEHIARWNSALHLENPGSGLGSDAVELTILRNGLPMEGTDIRLEYQLNDENWVEPEIQIRLKNKSSRNLYCALLGLTEGFEINTKFFALGSLRLKPGEEAFAFDNNPIPLIVPKALWDQGIIEVRDILKLIICTSDFDANLLAQPPLAQPQPNSEALLSDEEKATRAATRGGPFRRESAVDRLLSQVHTRAFDFGAARDLGDWRTTDVMFTTVRPRDSVAVPRAGESRALGPGVTLEGHSALAGAKARLSSVTASSRDLGGLALPPVLVENPSVSGPFTLVTATTRSDDPGLSVLELEDVADPGAITPDTPLCLLVHQKLEEGEHVLPVAFDGEFFLPLGRAERANGDMTRIILERLPGPAPENLPAPLVDKRSLFGSIRIYFQKVLSQVVGFDYPYPVLAAASLDTTGNPSQNADAERVCSLVSGAKRILLYIHGIIGETRTMVPSARLAQVAIAGKTGPLVEHYDLILSFDYENINTPIQQTARDLKARLAAVGLDPGHGKMLHVVAHSMGGLVSRWFIEREGGNQIVQHLVMLGTPNGGSPWPRLQDWATVSLSLVLNSLTVAVWPARALSALVAAIESVDVTLDQMVPGSELLADLAASPDPNLPYTVIAGDTAIKPAALRSQTERDGASVLQRLLRRLSANNALRLAADQVFLAPNDIAVAVASMGSLGPTRSPAVAVLPSACDHLTYFSDSSGLEVLARALAGAIDQPLSRSPSTQIS